jgi:hypothetical protein
MRTIVDLPQEQLDALEAICRREGISRAEAVRRAIAHHLKTEGVRDVDRAFGLWRAKPRDGVAWQRRLRREWDR